MDSYYSENDSIHPVECALCQQILSPDDDTTQEAENVNICGDCKFLYFEDLETFNPDFGRRRLSRGRRTRNNSFDSVEDLFSQQLLHMTTRVRQNQSALSGQDEWLANSNSLTGSVVLTSSNTTPSGSRRWRRVSSDSESEGFDVFDSLHGESESNVSFGQFRVHAGDADAVSFSVYGGASIASMDGQSFTDIDMPINPDEVSSVDSDADIDPMHAGLDQWNSDELEEDGDEDDDGWEVADEEENVLETAEARRQSPNFYFSSPSESNGPLNRWRRFHSPEYDGIIGLRIRERRTINSRNILPLEDSASRHYVGNSGDYLDGRGFEELLEHLAENDNSRRGAPPAAVSVVSSLPLIVINEKIERLDDLVCAICKDVLSIGTEVNQLPCLHLYHPSCIVPWLNTRNSCPLCRHELPTDDKDYEERKHNITVRIENHETQVHVNNDSSSDVSDGDGEDGMQFSQAITEQQHLLNENSAVNSSRRRQARGSWLLSAAGPIMGFVGIALALWIEHSLVRGQGQAAVGAQFQHFSANQTGNRRRRWWYIF